MSGDDRSAPRGVAHGRHEASDASPRLIAGAALGLTGLVLVSLLIAAGLYAAFGGRPAPLPPSLTPAPALLPRAVPPEPRLQPDPPAQLAALRAEEEKRLRSYGWVDRRAGVVRIPITRAIEVLARETGDGTEGDDAL